MEVILKHDVPNLGQKGQLVKVKRGFFKNFLSTQGLAIVATAKLAEEAKELNAKIEAEKMQKAKHAETIKRELENKVLHLKEKLTAKGTLYAKVTAEEISKAVSKQFDFECTKDMVTLNKPIKEAGDYEFKLKLAPTVSAIIKLTIEGEES